MEELSFPKFFVNGRSQQLTKTGGIFSPLHDCGRMLDCWQSAVYRDITSKRYDPIILFFEDRINGESFVIGEKEDSTPVILQVIQKRELFSRCFWAIAELNRGFLFDHPGQSERLKILLLCPSCYSVAWVVSNAFLVTSWFINWGLSN